jgi:hypothetical protein
MNNPPNAHRSRRLLAYLAPLPATDAGDSKPGNLRLTESTVLVLIVVLLALASVNDVARQTGVNHRLIADLHTWRLTTGHNYRNLAIQQDLNGHTTREIVCGNVTPGPPGSRAQICLIMVGKVVDHRRRSPGGYYLPPHRADFPRYRYGCFGSASASHLCPSRDHTAKAGRSK